MNALGNMQRGSPPTRLSWRAVHDAWRGITRVELRAAFLLGAAVFLYHLIVYFDFLLAYRLDLITADFVSLQIRAFALMLCVVVADHVTGQDTRRRAAYALAVIVSAALAAPLTAIVWAQMEGPEKRGNSAGIPFHEFFEWVLLGGAVTFVYIDRRRARAARARLHAAEIDRAHTATRMLESRLQAMQARVEPQFLFNTLAQVKRLYRVDAVLAERMLGELIAYLRAAMPKMRDTSSTRSRDRRAPARFPARALKFGWAIG